MLATIATAPSGVTSTPYGFTPATTSGFAYVTVDPSIARSEIRLSLFLDTSARRPSGVKTTWLGPLSFAPRSTVPAGVTRAPAIVNTEIVPSARFATSASVPALLIDTPDG
jgi:hypothetical protein